MRVSYRACVLAYLQHTPPHLTYGRGRRLYDVEPRRCQVEIQSPNRRARRRQNRRGPTFLATWSQSKQAWFARNGSASGSEDQSPFIACSTTTFNPASLGLCTGMYAIGKYGTSPNHFEAAHRRQSTSGRSTLANAGSAEDVQRMARHRDKSMQSLIARIPLSLRSDSDFADLWNAPAGSVLTGAERCSFANVMNSASSPAIRQCLIESSSRILSSTIPMKSRRAIGLVSQPAFNLSPPR